MQLRLGVVTRVQSRPRRWAWCGVEGSVEHLHGKRLAVVQLALLDPLEEVFAGKLRMHAGEVRVRALGRARDERVRALERPPDRHAGVEELDGRCGGEKKGGAKGAPGRRGGRNVRERAGERRGRAPGSQTAATTHAQ